MTQSRTNLLRHHTSYDYYWKIGLKLFGILIFFILFLSPHKCFAEKGLYLTPDTTSLETGKDLNVRVEIDTGGEKINAVGFNIDFPTELLEGQLPNRSGSIFPFWIVETSTRVDGGTPGQDGFSSNGTSGLITTLHFKGRQAGAVTISLSNIKVLFAGTALSGFTADDLNLTVYGAGLAPTTPEAEKKKAVKPITVTTEGLVQRNTAPAITFIQPPNPTETFGAEPQVVGTKGASQEETIKTADGSGSAPSVKGLFSQDNLFMIGIIPTLLLLALVIFLILRLLITEKRRHQNMERIFDKQLGTLASLESKIDLIDEKSESGKKQYIEEFEQAKRAFQADINPKTAVASNSAESVSK